MSYRSEYFVVLPSRMGFRCLKPIFKGQIVDEFYDSSMPNVRPDGTVSIIQVHSYGNYYTGEFIPFRGTPAEWAKFMRDIKWTLVKNERDSRGLSK